MLPSTAWPSVPKIRPEGKAMSNAQMVARIAELEAKLAAKQAVIRFKVSEKGAVSVYGLGRFPVTLYRGQWERLCGSIDELKAFIKANESKLSVKE
jgi:hypothetical protein